MNSSSTHTRTGNSAVIGNGGYPLLEGARTGPQIKSIKYSEQTKSKSNMIDSNTRISMQGSLPQKPPAPPSQVMRGSGMYNPSPLINRSVGNSKSSAIPKSQKRPPHQLPSMNMSDNTDINSFKGHP